MRVLTCNVGAGADRLAIIRLIADADPDLVALQECSPQRAAAIFDGTGWYVRQGHLQCIASPYPLHEAEVLSRRALDAWGVSGIRCLVHTPRGTVQFANLHLATPREGVEAVLYGRLAGLERMRESTAFRRTESQRVSRWLREADDPLIIAGDLNMTVESAIYREAWSGFQNAFSQAGLGFGHTKFTGWHGVRIDHVLADDHWRITACRVGPDLGGDHRPVIADLARRGP